MQSISHIKWLVAEVNSPHIAQPVAVIAAKDLPYIPFGNRLENLSIYLPKTPENEKLVGTPVTSLPSPGIDPETRLPRWRVHIHGGAWRDPELTSTSIEPSVAHAFFDKQGPITAIASINYTVCPFPTHPRLPYDPVADGHSDPAREASHPKHVSDALHGFALLRSLGLSDDSYILSGHSCGACISLQSVLQPTTHWGLGEIPDPPRPAALLGLNGLYDLKALVYGLGASHEHLGEDYEMFLSNAFGADKSKWSAASPASFDVDALSARVREGKAPRLILLDQSTEDQLVPMNQRERLESNLKRVQGLSVVRGHQLTGRHADVWLEGYMIWNTVLDVLKLLKEQR